VQLLILGTGLFALEVADLAAEIPGIEVAGFIENLEREKCGVALEGLPVHWVDDVGALASAHHAVCSLGTTHRVRFIEQVAALGMPFATVVHPTARISGRSEVGAGAIVSAGCIVGAHTHIGAHARLNRGVLVGHHTEIGDYATLQPGANIAGACRIGEGAYIGIGAIVLDRLSIGAHSVVGAGAVVTKDVAAKVQVFGVPARVVRTGVDGK
jgi:sugar O-acyltransferase (sialic acid O-acetyltransferase NeuD family)